MRKFDVQNLTPGKSQTHTTCPSGGSPGCNFTYHSHSIEEIVDVLFSSQKKLYPNGTPSRPEDFFSNRLVDTYVSKMVAYVNINEGSVILLIPVERESLKNS
jgi:hypothetical protein